MNGSDPGFGLSITLTHILNSFPYFINKNVNTMRQIRHLAKQLRKCNHYNHSANQTICGDRSNFRKSRKDTIKLITLSVFLCRLRPFSPSFPMIKPHQLLHYWKGNSLLGSVWPPCLFLVWSSLARLYWGSPRTTSRPSQIIRLSGGWVGFTSHTCEPSS